MLHVGANKYPMLNIYSESSHTQYWLTQSNITSYNITENIQDWLYTDNRAAVVEVWDTSETNVNNLRFLSNRCGLLIIFIPEFTSDWLVKEFDLPNVVFFVSGALNYSLANAQVYFCPYFFSSTVDFYRTETSILESLEPADNAKFDVLLGRRKTHRDIIYKTLDHKQHVITYFPSHEDSDIKQYNNKQFKWPSILPQPEESVDMTAHAVKVNGTIVSLSQIIPTEIYNQTRYTLVAETCTNNSFSFYTEKVVKPILAKRLFVVAAGQHYLKNLQRLGFKTFAGIIDESYDDIADLEKRTLAVCRLAKHISTLDPNLLQSVIDPILKHNYQHMMTFNWQGQMIFNIGSVINKYQQGDLHV